MGAGCGRETVGCWGGSTGFARRLGGSLGRAEDRGGMVGGGIGVNVAVGLMFSISEEPGTGGVLSSILALTPLSLVVFRLGFKGPALAAGRGMFSLPPRGWGAGTAARGFPRDSFPLAWAFSGSLSLSLSARLRRRLGSGSGCAGSGAIEVWRVARRVAAGCWGAGGSGSGIASWGRFRLRGAMVGR